MNKIKEFLKINKNELYWIIPIFIFGTLLIGARQKALANPIFWSVIPLGIFCCLLLGLLLTLYTDIGARWEFKQ